eukprot:5599051-Prymnesium_polylepis.1
MRLSPWVPKCDIVVTSRQSQRPGRGPGACDGREIWSTSLVLPLSLGAALGGLESADGARFVTFSPHSARGIKNATREAE